MCALHARCGVDGRSRSNVDTNIDNGNDSSTLTRYIPTSQQLEALCINNTHTENKTKEATPMLKPTPTSNNNASPPPTTTTGNNTDTTQQHRQHYQHYQHMQQRHRQHYQQNYQQQEQQTASRQHQGMQTMQTAAHLNPNARLDRNSEHLSRDELLQFVRQH